LSLAQFDKLVAEGRKLVILDDRIIDLDNFEFNHPGGKHMIQTNIGRDISKFFHGGYTLESSAAPHKHTNYAYTIVNELQIAFLDSKKQTEVYAIKSSEKACNVDGIKTFKFVK